MGFTAISIEKYIRMHMANNPSTNESDLRKSLNSASTDYKNRVKCYCGNDIWVIGSASVGNSCFTCITGESQPDNDFEIASALSKREDTKGKKHIDQMDINQIYGLFDDDGFEINSEMIKKPSLCLICIHNDDPNEEILCNLTRHDQKDDDDFVCFAYKKNN